MGKKESLHFRGFGIFILETLETYVFIKVAPMYAI